LPDRAYMFRSIEYIRFFWKKWKVIADHLELEYKHELEGDRVFPFVRFTTINVWRGKKLNRKKTKQICNRKILRFVNNSG